MADELITSRGKRVVRVGNTDAEGRMVMADPLCEAKELALNSVNPLLFTIATLTGHVIRAYGPDYTVQFSSESTFSFATLKLFLMRSKHTCVIIGNYAKRPGEASTPSISAARCRLEQCLNHFCVDD